MVRSLMSRKDHPGPVIYRLDFENAGNVPSEEDIFSVCGDLDRLDGVKDAEILSGADVAKDSQMTKICGERDKSLYVRLGADFNNEALHTILEYFQENRTGYDSLAL